MMPVVYGSSGPFSPDDLSDAGTVEIPPPSSESTTPPTWKIVQHSLGAGLTVLVSRFKALRFKGIRGIRLMTGGPSWNAVSSKPLRKLGEGFAIRFWKERKPMGGQVASIWSLDSSANGISSPNRGGYASAQWTPWETLPPEEVPSDPLANLIEQDSLDFMDTPEKRQALVDYLNDLYEHDPQY